MELRMILKIKNLLAFKNLPKWARLTLWICIPFGIIAIFTGLCIAFGFEPVVNILSKVLSIVGILL